MSRRRLLLVRHGVTEWVREGRFQGHRDPPLDADGREQAALVAARLAADDALRPARVVTSTLSRARETAQAIATSSGATLREDDRLMEIGQGEWEGRTHDELAATDGERYAAWRRHSAHQPPGAEPMDAVRTRVMAAISDLLGGHLWPACIVSHGGALRLLAEGLLGLEPARAWALDVDNASVSALVEIHGGDESATWRIECWNDSLHLLGRQPTHLDEAEGQPLAL